MVEVGTVLECDVVLVASEVGMDVAVSFSVVVNDFVVLIVVSVFIPEKE